MVYRGKPSKGCEACRRRRIACDRSEGGCRNCQRLGQECSGYRDELDLLFLHETDRVTRKYVRLPKTSETDPGEVVGPFNDSSQAALSKLDVEHLAARFGYPSVDDFALSYGYHWHVVHPDNSSNVSTIVADTKLQSCLRALGMASLSATIPVREAVSAARKYYVDSLRLINAALSSKDSAVEDTTLLAVIALCLYETIVGSDTRSMEAWAQHVQGTAALLELRGLGQMWTPKGRFLYLQATIGIMSNCSRLGIHLPSCIGSLTEEFLSHVDDPSSPMWQNFSAKLQLIDMWADVKREEFNDPGRVLVVARELDKAYEQPLFTGETDWAQDAHSRAMFFPLRTSLLTGRIECHLIILAILHRCPASAPTDVAQRQIEKSRQIIRKQQTDALANARVVLDAKFNSVRAAESAFQNGLPIKADKVFPALPRDYFHAANLALVDFPVWQTIPGNVLLWQLALVSRAADPGSPNRVAACDVLRGFGRVMGMSQAFRMAEVLENECENLVLGMREESHVIGAKRTTCFP